MSPLLEAGDRIGVEWLEAAYSKEPLKKGDLVVLRSVDQWVVHRVVKLSPLKTKGDNTYSVDQSPFYQPEIAVFGRVLALCKKQKNGVRNFQWIQSGLTEAWIARLSYLNSRSPRGVRKLIKVTMQWMLRTKIGF